MASPRPDRRAGAVVRVAGTARTSRSRSAAGCRARGQPPHLDRARAAVAWTARRRPGRGVPRRRCRRGWRGPVRAAPGRPSTRGRSSGTSRSTPRGAADDRRRATHLVDGHTVGVPRTARRPAGGSWSSRLSTRAASRSADSSMVASSSSCSAWRPGHVGLPQAGGGGLDAGQRGAQVVPDRGEQRGADPVDLGKLLRPRCLLCKACCFPSAAGSSGESFEQNSVLGERRAPYPNSSSGQSPARTVPGLARWRRPDRGNRLVGSVCGARVTVLMPYSCRTCRNGWSTLTPCISAELRVATMCV